MPEEDQTDYQQPAPPRSQSHILKGIIFILLAFILLFGGAYAGYWYGSQRVEVQTQIPTSPVSKAPEEILKELLDEREAWISVVNTDLGVSFEIPPSLMFIYERYGDYYRYSEGVDGASWLSVYKAKNMNDLKDSWISHKTYANKGDIPKDSVEQFFTFTEASIAGKPALHVTPGEKFVGIEGWRETVMELDSNSVLIIVTAYFPQDPQDPISQISDEILSTFQFLD